MKKLMIPLLMVLILAPTEKAFSIFGVGAYYVNDPISVDGGEEGAFPISLVREGFDGAQLGGLFLYIDAIPFIDLEVSGESSISKYQFQFKNAISDLPSTEFAWARVSGYLTLRKKVFSLGMPVLGGLRLNLGGGLNMHSSTPLASLSMVETLLGDLSASFNADNLEDNLVEYLKENKIDASGFHVQAGLQLKLLALNAFVNYRITMAEDVVPGSKSFSSLWAGLAFGI